MRPPVKSAINARVLKPATNLDGVSLKRGFSSEWLVPSLSPGLPESGIRKVLTLHPI